MKRSITLSKKICLLGTFGVGKTSLVRRFVYDEFKEDYLSTMGVHIHKKTVSATQDEYCNINLIIWDIAHIEKFNSIIKNYFRGSHGAVVVFDLTRPLTFQGSHIYLDPFLEMNPKSKLVFVGNKIDLIEKESNEMEQLLQLSKAYNSPIIKTSAKNNENVEELFSKIGNLLVKVD